MSLDEDIRYLLGQIDGKVTVLVQQGKIQDDRIAAIESRIRNVEGKQHWYAGAAAALSAGATWLASKGFHL
jgi:hypothetical protein